MFDVERGPGPDPVGETAPDSESNQNPESANQVTPQSDFEKQRARVAEGVARPLDAAVEVPVPDTESVNNGKDSEAVKPDAVEQAILEPEVKSESIIKGNENGSEEVKSESFELPREVYQPTSKEDLLEKSSKPTAEKIADYQSEIANAETKVAEINAALQVATGDEKIRLEAAKAVAERTLKYNRAMKETAEQMESESNQSTEAVSQSNEASPDSIASEPGNDIPKQPEIYSGKESEFQKIIDQAKTPEERLRSARENLGFLKKAGLRPVLEGAEAKFYDAEGNEVKVSDLASKLGGVENAREALGGLSELVNIYFAKPELFTKTESKEVPPKTKEKNKDPIPTFRAWGNAASNRLTNVWRNLTDYSRSPVLNAYNEANNRFSGWQEKVSNNYSELKKALAERLNSIKESASSNLDSFRNLFKKESIDNTYNLIDLLPTDRDGSSLNWAKEIRKKFKESNEARRKQIEALKLSKEKAKLQKELANLKESRESQAKALAQTDQKINEASDRLSAINKAENQEIPQVEPISLEGQVDEVDPSTTSQAIKLDQPGSESAGLSKAA